MNKQILYIVGAIAAILGLYFISTRRDAIVQAPQIGQIGTAPGPDTTGVELGFKSNIFSTYTDYLKSIAAGEQATSRVKLQSELENQRIAAGTTAATLAQTGLTDRQRLTEEGLTTRAKIFADADVATVGQRSAAELQRLQLQDSFNRSQAGRQSQGNALNEILKALGQLARSGRGGGAIPQPSSREQRPSRGRIPGYPSGIGPILTPPFNPGEPAINLPGFDIFAGMDDFYNPFADFYDPFYGNDSGQGAGTPIFGDTYTEYDPNDPYAGFSDYVDTYGGYGGSGGFDEIGRDYYDSEGGNYYPEEDYG